MNLHVLYNGGDGTYDVVNIKDDGTLEYMSDGFSTGEGAHGFIEGWHAAGEYAAPTAQGDRVVEIIDREYDPTGQLLNESIRYRD